VRLKEAAGLVYLLALIAKATLPAHVHDAAAAQEL